MLTLGFDITTLCQKMLTLGFEPTTFLPANSHVGIGQNLVFGQKMDFWNSVRPAPSTPFGFITHELRARIRSLHVSAIIRSGVEKL